MPVIEDLDVRPLLQRGEEPFSVIMDALGRVPQDGGLRLRSTFEPVPLYAVLSRQGYTHVTRQLGADDWEVLFTRGTSVEDGAQPASAGKLAGESEEVIHLDVSDLVPPEPMVRILETAAHLQPGQVLQVDHHRRPVYLYPQLEAQGFVHETIELGPGQVQIRIRRA